MRASINEITGRYLKGLSPVKRHYLFPGHTVSTGVAKLFDIFLAAFLAVHKRNNLEDIKSCLLRSRVASIVDFPV